MKHEVKYQELNDEQLTMVVGGKWHPSHNQHNSGDTTNTFQQGSPLALNVNTVSQTATNSKNVDQNSASYQSSNAVNSINNKP